MVAARSNRKAGSAEPAQEPIDIPDNIVTDVFARIGAKTEEVTAKSEVGKYDARVLDWLEGVWKGMKRAAKRGTKVDPPAGIRVEGPDGFVLVTLVAPEDKLDLDDVVLRSELVKAYGQQKGNAYADRLYVKRTVTEFSQDELRRLQDADIVTGKMISTASIWKPATHYPKYTPHLNTTGAADGSTDTDA